jgi:hypothetical protein
VTSREAIAVLRAKAIATADAELADAIGEVIDHVSRIEQFASIVRASMASAERAIPSYAVMPDDAGVRHRKAGPK